MLLCPAKRLITVLPFFLFCRKCCSRSEWSADRESEVEGGRESIGKKIKERKAGEGIRRKQQSKLISFSKPWVCFLFDGLQLREAQGPGVNIKPSRKVMKSKFASI